MNPMNGFHSRVDVDQVDLDMYPTLRDAHFFEANLEAGDCLFIPYMWVHQVKKSSFNLLKCFSVGDLSAFKTALDAVMGSLFYMR